MVVEDGRGPMAAVDRGQQDRARLLADPRAGGVDAAQRADLVDQRVHEGRPRGASDDGVRQDPVAAHALHVVRVFVEQRQPGVAVEQGRERSGRLDVHVDVQAAMLAQQHVAGQVPAMDVERQRSEGVEPVREGRLDELVEGAIRPQDHLAIRIEFADAAVVVRIGGRDVGGAPHLVDQSRDRAGHGSRSVVCGGRAARRAGAGRRQRRQGSRSDLLHESALEPAQAPGDNRPLRPGTPMQKKIRRP